MPKILNQKLYDDVKKEADLIYAVRLVKGQLC